MPYWIPISKQSPGVLLHDWVCSTWSKEGDIIYAFKNESAPIQEAEEPAMFVVWVDNKIGNNEELDYYFKQCYLKGIKVQKFQTSFDALAFLRKSKASFESNKNVELRIISNRTRPWEDEKGNLYAKMDKMGNVESVQNTQGLVVKYNDKAGQELFEAISRMDYGTPQMFKIVHSRTPRKEIEAFCFFFPEYLSLGSDYFYAAKSYLYF